MAKGLVERELEDGLPAVRDVGLPTLERGLAQGKNLNDAGCAALLAMLDESSQVVATGSCFGNTLRCFAVSGDHQGEGLLNQIVTHLIAVQLERGNVGLFLYTKLSTARFFSGLGF